MQEGSVTVERRKRGPDVWCFRWREAGPDWRRIHRRIVLGTADELRSIASARKMVFGLRREININDIRIRRESIKLADLSQHFQQRELADRNPRISYSTKRRTRATWKSGLTRAGASIGCWTFGLRRSELFALQWKDVDFHTKQIYVTRSIVQNVVGICKTESSQKPVPAHHDLVEALREWHGQTPYQSSESWVFASPVNQGRWPYLAQQIMRRHILPVARKLGITKRIGWHTFRHTYSTLLRSTGAELKTMQELLRHSTIRVTLDTYTQAVTTEKRKAQEAMVELLFPGKMQKT